MRVGNSLPPTLLGVEPGDEMELEVVATEGPLESDRGGRQRRSEHDKSWAEESVPAENPAQFGWEAIRPCY